MILADTNIWLALALSKHEFHSAASDWLAGQSSQKRVLFCRSTQQSFLRLLTTDNVMRLYDLAPMTNAAAWSIYDGFRSDRRISYAPEPDGLDALWKSLSARLASSPKLWMDAYLAAFALAGGHQLVTTDKGFRQFHELNPIVLSNP
ncbi:PIN domain-containing protein [Candidatus Sumerlaeota bacterium]|nr:PIN domain-containing protein [Candidatus Sumerlaeota bacterium]